VRATDRLTADDQLILWPDELWPQDIGALTVLDGSSLVDPGGRLRIEAITAAVEARLDLVPRFRQLLYTPRRGLGPPLWVDAPAFKITDQVRILPLPAPGDEAQLLLTTEQLRRHRLDRSRPLWEMWFLPGLSDQRIGLFIRIHHVIADGIAGVATVGAFLDAAPGAPALSAPPWTPVPAPTARDLFTDNLRLHARASAHALSMLVRPRTMLHRLRGGWPMMRGLVTQPRIPKTSLDKVVGPDRNLAVIRGRVELVKGIAHANNAKVNDVLLVLVAGGLRALLRSRGDEVDDQPILVYVPVTLRQGHREQARGNLVSQMVVPLPIGVSDPSERLRQVASETAKRKAASHPSLGSVFGSRIARWALLKLLDRQPVNVTTADLPGPPSPMYLAGARLLEVFPVLPLIGKVPLGVGALSYADQFNLMAVADKDAVPDLDIFVAGVEDELQELARAHNANVTAH
jgi:WS/DGAT/MGAT family acyltransferase